MKREILYPSLGHIGQAVWVQLIAQLEASKRATHEPAQ